MIKEVAKNDLGSIWNHFRIFRGLAEHFFVSMVFWSSSSIISTCCRLRRHMLFTFFCMFLISELGYFYSKLVSNCLNVWDVAWFKSGFETSQWTKVVFCPNYCRQPNSRLLTHITLGVRKKILSILFTSYKTSVYILGRPTVSLRSCEYWQNDESFNDKMHYITMILYLNYKKNKKTVL